MKGYWIKVEEDGVSKGYVGFVLTMREAKKVFEQWYTDMRC